jgi:hypothetical protein
MRNESGLCGGVGGPQNGRTLLMFEGQRGEP